MSIYYLTPVNRLAGMTTSYNSRRNRKPRKRKQYACYCNASLVSFRKDFAKQLKKAKALSCDLTANSLKRKLNVIDNILTSRNFYG